MPTDPSSPAPEPSVAALRASVLALLHDDLHVSVETVDAELFDSGLIDSLTFVDLLFQLEQKFGVAVQLDDIDPDRFRTVTAIADYVQAHQGP